MSDDDIEKAIEALKAQPGTTDQKVIDILEGLLAAVKRRPDEEEVSAKILIGI